MARIVAQIRARWPRTRILLRADSGFAREELMGWCEEAGADYLFGLARTARLLPEIATGLAEAAGESGRPGRPARRFKDFPDTALNSWSRVRRAAGKAEWLAPKETAPGGHSSSSSEPAKGEANPRFAVTSLAIEACKARRLYPGVLMKRSLAPAATWRPASRNVNAISLIPSLPRDADRTSAATMRANQPRLYFCFNGLYPCLRSAPDRPRTYAICKSEPRHDPPQALQDRRPRPVWRAADQNRHGLGFSLPASPYRQVLTGKSSAVPIKLSPSTHPKAKPKEGDRCQIRPYAQTTKRLPPGSGSLAPEIR